MISRCAIRSHWKLCELSILSFKVITSDAKSVRSRWATREFEFILESLVVDSSNADGASSGLDTAVSTSYMTLA